jgi:hypothetical protein
MAERRKPIKAGDRVIQESSGQRGIVVDVTARQAHVHWGTFNRVEFKSWEQKTSLLRDDERIVTPDEIAARMKTDWLGELANVGSRVEVPGEGN